MNKFSLNFLFSDHNRHPNIANNYGFFHNEIKIYFILEFCPNGNLFDKIADKPLDEPQAATVLKTC